MRRPLIGVERRVEMAPGMLRRMGMAPQKWAGRSGIGSMRRKARVRAHAAGMARLTRPVSPMR